MSTKWKYSLVFFLGILGVITLYWPGLHGPFLLDDLQSIQPAQMDVFSWRKLIQICFENDTGPIGRPISILSFALNNYFWGINAFSYKLINLIIHIICALSISYFLYLLLNQFTHNKKNAVLISVVTALLWMAHPLQVSTVLYPVQRMTELSALFLLGGLICYLLGRIRLIHNKKQVIPLFLISFGIFFPLSVLSKENGLLFPLYLLIIEYFILGFQCPQKRDMRIIKRSLYFMSGAFIIGGTTYFLMKYNLFSAIYNEKSFSLYARLLTESKALVFYIQLILLPKISQLGLYHDDFIISHDLDYAALGSLFILGLLGFTAYFFRKKQPILAFGISWFFISHIIESTVIPLELVFEHRNYLASLGLLLPVVFYLISFLTAKPYSILKKISTVASCLVVCSLLVVTNYRTHAFSSAEKFLRDARTFHPLSPRAHIETANWLLEKKLYGPALSELNYAQTLDPTNAGIALHQMLVFCKLQNIPPYFYSNALYLLENHAITPYVIMVLDAMVQNMFTQQCSTIDRNKLIKMIQAAYNNPLIRHRPLYKAVLYHLEAGLQLMEKNISQTRLLLIKSYVAYPKRIDPLIEKGYLEANHGYYKEANSTLDFVNRNKLIRSPADQIEKLEKTILLLYPEAKSHEH